MIASNKGERLIFVGGAPRSGTTLVQNILGTHPDICAIPEFLHMRQIVELRNSLHRSIDYEYINLICSEADVDEHTSNLTESLLLPLADINGCRLLSEKTPENILIFSELIELFPNARFIHIVRDPRAVVSSLLQVGARAKAKLRDLQKYTRNIKAAIRHTKECQMKGFLTSKENPEKVLTIVYKQLVSDAEHETLRICKFLGIPWSSEMITPSKFKHLGEKAITTSSGEVWYNTQTYNRDPNPNSLNKWQSLLTTTQKSAIANSFGTIPNLNELGYDFSEDRRFSIRGYLISLISEAPTFNQVLQKFKSHLKKSKFAKRIVFLLR